MGKEVVFTFITIDRKIWKTFKRFVRTQDSTVGKIIASFLCGRQVNADDWVGLASAFYRVTL